MAFDFTFNEREKIFSSFNETRVAEYTFGVVFARLVKSIHVELTYETIDFSVTEIARKNNLFEFIDILDDKILAWGAPKYYFTKLFILNNKI